ncbi:DUF2200 family protein [Lapidilactobacillus wuchangensis]|uniref:DUF2200 family protein n=1 Tax=Lapidilactobacillus wuchangensis TaxID=2486001 RepID=UPI000F79287F|nr:DUF2200 family protein [Lapidilactobacillus wuchangensis]
MQASDKVLAMNFGDIYPLYVKKVERKGRTAADVLQVVTWLTGYSVAEIQTLQMCECSLAEFFNQAPALNPNRKLLRGRICGIKVEEMAPGTMQEIRFMDKLVDDVAKGKAWSKIFPA